MKLVHFSPFSEIDNVQQQMNRLFDEISGWKAEEKGLWRPAVEILEGDNVLTLKASLPGLSGDDIDITLTSESARIAGEYTYSKTQEDQGCYHSEFRYGKFDRTINLPTAIDHQKATAKFENGILELTLPKIVPSEKKVVKLKLGEGTQSSIEEASTEE